MAMDFRKMWSLVLCMATFGLAGCAGESPTGLGLTDGRLAPCPDSPNCVSSQSESEYASMEPIPLTLSAQEAQEKLAAILQGMDRMKIISQKPGYIHAEASSKIFRFVDDVEFVIDEADGVIHYRSASRMGYGDMNANRERMVEILGRYAGETS
jgi:uncharacterized protein (DUF1499 family)